MSYFEITSFCLLFDAPWYGGAICAIVFLYRHFKSLQSGKVRIMGKTMKVISLKADEADLLLIDGLKAQYDGSQSAVIRAALRLLYEKAQRKQRTGKQAA
jgi:hypothetical protein